MADVSHSARVDSIIVSLIGINVTSDRDLARRIMELGVTVEYSESYREFEKKNWEQIRIVVFECGDGPRETVQQIKEMRDKFNSQPPGGGDLNSVDFDIVLINGGLNGIHLAKAWQAGIKDYFKSPYDVALLTERIQFLLKARIARPHISRTETTQPDKRNE